MKTKICIIGQSGFVGNTIYNYFITNNYEVKYINSKTKQLSNTHFDVIVNCAGNPKKYLAESNPEIDIHKNISPFLRILKLKLKTKHFIHISSIDACNPQESNYAKSKIVTENCAKLYFPKTTVLRLGGLIGPYLSKNVVYDIVNNKNLFVTFNSTYNYISTQEVAKIVEQIITLNIWNKTINIAASKPIKVNKIIEEAKKRSISFTKTEGLIKENYRKINILELNKFFKVKTSLFYIKKYLHQPF